MVLALAVARLTGLITQDEITRPLRDGFLRRLDEARAFHRFLAYLAVCPWCASIYVGAFAAVMAWLAGVLSAAFVPVAALAFSQVAGMTSGIGRPKVEG